VVKINDNILPLCGSDFCCDLWLNVWRMLSACVVFFVDYDKRTGSVFFCFDVYPLRLPLCVCVRACMCVSVCATFYNFRHLFSAKQLYVLLGDGGWVEDICACD
jgi:hypothetical protein